MHAHKDGGCEEAAFAGGSDCSVLRVRRRTVALCALHRSQKSTQSAEKDS